MSSATAGGLFIGSLLVALALSYRPLGDYIYRVYTGPRHLAVERGMYRLIGVQPGSDTDWQAHSGESTMGHLVQTGGLAVQNFVSAAVGMVVGVTIVLVALSFLPALALGPLAEGIR